MAKIMHLTIYQPSLQAGTEMVELLLVYAILTLIDPNKIGTPGTYLEDRKNFGSDLGIKTCKLFDMQTSVLCDVCGRPRFLL